jgi:hypothetical protein
MVDRKTEERLPFWNDSKPFRKMVTYGPANSYHARFVTAAAILRGLVFGSASEREMPVRTAVLPLPLWTGSNLKIEIKAKVKKKPPSVDSDELLRIDV